MTVDPTSAAASLLAALEAQTRRPGRPEKAAVPARERGASDRRRPSLAEDLARIAEALDIDSRDSYERARRQAVSVLLQHQLGRGLRELPDWSNLVERVADAIGADPAVDGRMAAWLGALKS